MPLLNQSVQVPGQIGKLFETIRLGQAPDKFTREFLKDIGFASSNHHAFIPLLKGLGFLTADGAPTQRYRDFLDETRSRRILADALREAYGDIFTIKTKPTKSDKKLIAGKFKSTFNLSETSAERTASTFLSLLELADQDYLFSHSPVQATASVTTPSETKMSETPTTVTAASPIGIKEQNGSPDPVGLHYNIQIHLPATKDVEVYNSIFKSLREHLID